MVAPPDNFAGDFAAGPPKPLTINGAAATVSAVSQPPESEIETIELTWPPDLGNKLAPHPSETSVSSEIEGSHARLQARHPVATGIGERGGHWIARSSRVMTLKAAALLGSHLEG